MFCDLLSRNGCVTAVTLYDRLHATDTTHPKAITTPQPQYTIIMPTGVAITSNTKQPRSRDLDIADNPLLPTLSMDRWPTARHISAAQSDASLKSPTFKDVDGHQLLTDTRGRILLPAPSPDTGNIVDTVIVAGDMFHRSSDATHCR